MHPYRRYFTLIAWGTIATVGITEGAKGVILPHFLTDLSLNAATGAAIFSASSLGNLFTSMSYGALTQRSPLKRVATVGIVVALSALTLFMRLGDPIWLYVAMAGFGAGSTMIEMTTSMSISLLYDKTQGAMLNLLHGIFGIGTLGGTLLAAFSLSRGAGWRPPLLIVGLLLTGWVAGYRALPALPLPRLSGKAAGWGPLLRDPLVWAAAIALSASVAGEAGSALWLPSYLQQEKGLSEAVSAGYVTLFFAGFTVTRLAGSWIVQRVGYVRSIILLAVAGAIGMGGLLLLPGRFAWLATLAGAGVAIAFATCIALVATRYPDRVNRVYALMYSSGGLAGILTGPIIGWVAGRYGLSIAMGLPLAAYATMIIMMGYYAVVDARRPRRIA